MPLIRGLPRITPAQPMQKRAPDGSESDSGWQIVTHNFCSVLMAAEIYRSLNKKHSDMHDAS